LEHKTVQVCPNQPTSLAGQHTVEETASIHTLYRAPNPKRLSSLPVIIKLHESMATEKNAQARFPLQDSQKDDSTLPLGVGGYLGRGWHTCSGSLRPLTLAVRPRRWNAKTIVRASTATRITRGSRDEVMNVGSGSFRLPRNCARFTKSRPSPVPPTFLRYLNDTVSLFREAWGPLGPDRCQPSERQHTGARQRTTSPVHAPRRKGLVSSSPRLT
jgi:hypothetical protein